MRRLLSFCEAEPAFNESAPPSLHSITPTRGCCRSRPGAEEWPAGGDSNNKPVLAALPPSDSIYLQLIVDKG